MPYGYDQDSWKKKLNADVIFRMAEFVLRFRLGRTAILEFEEPTLISTPGSGFFDEESSGGASEFIANFG